MSCEQKTKISTDHEHTRHFLYDQSTTSISVEGICEGWKGSSALALLCPEGPRLLDTEWTLTKGTIS